jgi:protein gp37
MSQHTEISWCDSTFNPWEGCQKVGPGCDHCYAETRNARYAGGRAINWGPGAPRRRTGVSNWKLPPRWNAKPFYECEGCGWRGEDDTQSSRLRICLQCGTRLVSARRRVFCASLADVLDNAVPDTWADDLWDLIDDTPNLDWLLTTKRIGNARTRLPARWLKPGAWPSHVRMIITVVNQQEADRDIPKLMSLGCPNGLSMEPLLASVAIWRWLAPHCERHAGQLEPDGKCEVCEGRGIWGMPGDTPLQEHEKAPIRQGIDWVIAGGESGPGARPMHPDWVRSLRYQCAAASVPFHFKQWGEWNPGTVQEAVGAHKVRVEPSGDVHPWPPIFVVGTGPWCMSKVGKKAAGRLLDGIEHNGFPGGA